MDRTAKSRSAGSGRDRIWLLREAVFIPFSSAASALLTIVLAFASEWRPVAILAAVLLVLSGAAQRFRARHAKVVLERERRRLAPDAFKQLSSRIGVELRFARFWTGTGVVMVAAVLWTPSPIALVLGVGATALLLLKGIDNSARTVELEDHLDLSKTRPIDECWCIKRWAEKAKRVPLIPGARCFSRLATYEVAPGDVGLLQSLALWVVLIAMVSYLSLGAALGATWVLHQSNHSAEAGQGRVGRAWSAPKRDLEAQLDPEESQGQPTYAESCPALPDPQEIGHGLGSLFERDGAVKAGCGNPAIEVAGLGVWASTGICSGELRSVAVSATERAVILYGAAAEFAWELAQNGELIGAQAAEPGAGDLDLVEATSGTYAFVRSNRSVSAGNDEARRCDEVGGVAQPFVRLAPPMVLLWRDLLQHDRRWSWPTDGSGGTGTITFSGYPYGETVARGDCESDSSCSLEVDGETWPGEGTSFVSLEELSAYAPAHAE